MVRPLLLGAALALSTAYAQTAEPPKHEFRGAWVATVSGLDWPSCTSCGADVQRAELAEILDGLKAVGVNAVLFQVRPAADAFYESPFEPWSHWLSGDQGRDPGYDPLAFAVEEAHARGMELHAWFNPYRAQTGSYALDPEHVLSEHPEWGLTFGSIKILNPGLPEVRDYVSTVIADVARRYEIDGVHFDDYFYPYPPNTIQNEDADTFAQYGGGFQRISDWRRFNVFRFVRQVRDSIAVARPEAVFGISPFGIWKSGVPAGTRGLDAFNVLFADAVAWLSPSQGEPLLDYVTPQLYWPFEGGQDYALLAPWWESVRNGRHLYPGHGLYRASRSTYPSGTLYAADEVPRQVRFNRQTEGIQGSVFFRALNLTSFSSRGFADTLRTDLFRHPALPPVMAWRSQDAPGTPTDLALTEPASGPLALSWSAPAAGDAEARFYAVYRVPEAEAGDLDAALQRAENLLAVTGGTSITDTRPAGAFTYVVTAVSPNSVESAPSNAVSVTNPVSNEPAAPVALALDAPRPNPSAGPVTLSYSVGAAGPVTLRVLDVLGREVAVLADGATHAAGDHTAVWRPEAAGTYLVVLDDGRQRAVRTVAVVR